jgi:hypothetical protein
MSRKTGKVTNPTHYSPSAAVRLHGAAPLRIFALVVSFTGAALYETRHLSSLADQNVWWHLRTGLWILESHSLPHNGLFSQYMSLGWTASSWGYDLLLGILFHLIGLRSIPIACMALQGALAVTLFFMAHGSQRLWPAVFLSAAAQVTILGLTSQPLFCSMILFAIELALLFQVRQTGDLRPLYWLPLLFMLWANLDGTFVYGLIPLGFLHFAACVDQLCLRGRVFWFACRHPAISLSPLAAITAGSALAGIISPYGYKLYGAILKQLASNAYSYVADFHALNFRTPQDYLLLLLSMAAFLSLGRARSRDLFAILLMAAAVMISCALQRERWIAALTSVAVIANSFCSSATQPQISRPDKLRGETLAAAALTVLVLMVASVQLPSGRQLLTEKVGSLFPVEASDYIRSNNLSQPLFNDYQWGGFLTWYLPGYPVSIDQRSELYGDELNMAYFRLVNGLVPLNSDPSFAGAQTIVSKRTSGLAAALGASPQFDLAYSDDLATVFVRKKGF